ncbi:hypothetical protein SBOR_7427 [Sclerotinia borealis F-4128]|uniref:Mid2 domain-containing protein n=1 Tax=Sclerotinia borealis (strain F-4128) TaxID=1432307 RepID=W9CC78_SCLBF|nr:hypothetical protein SBOR_7427 [Sclerotinia borealis F-4128]
MIGPMRQIRINKHSLLTAACLFGATFAQASNIFERATCPESSYVQCTNTGLPSDFCCPSTSTCISLAQNTTLLCCPSGSDCSTIQPITCDVTQQNITAHPENTLKTTALKETLEKCGSNCCPFGYTCVNGNCNMNADQAESVPGQQQSSAVSSVTSSIATSSSTKATSTANTPSSTITPLSTSATSSTSTPITIIPKTSEKFPIDAILVGFFPGLALGVLLALLGVCCIGRRKASHRKSGSSFGNISDPVPTSDVRTDFLRKMPQTPSTFASGTPRRQKTITRVRSLFRKSTATGMTNSPRMPYQNSPPPAPPIPLNIQRQKPTVVSGDRPVTPPLQREPSYEDINIFTDADTASSFREQQQLQHQQHKQNINQLGVPPAFLGQERGNRQTTFTDMMERSGLAGLQKGQRTYQLLHDNLSKQEEWKDRDE